MPINKNPHCHKTKERTNETLLEHVSAENVFYKNPAAISL